MQARGTSWRTVNENVINQVRVVCLSLVRGVLSTRLLSLTGTQCTLQVSDTVDLVRLASDPANRSLMAVVVGVSVVVVAMALGVVGSALFFRRRREQRRRTLMRSLQRHQSDLPSWVGSASELTLVKEEQ